MTRLTPRRSQLATLEEVKKRNLIVNLRTGGGKTLIAVLAIEAFRRSHPKKKIMFIVPTRILVSQQSKYIKNQLDTDVDCPIVELMGAHMEGWTDDDWSRCLSNNTIFVGTPEVFRRGIVDLVSIDLCEFSLIVFDEVHNATGGSPMAHICKGGLFHCPAGKAPRVLGLTASFINGSIRNINTKRHMLEELLQSTLYSPPTHLDCEKTKHLRTVTYETVLYPRTIGPRHEELVEEKMNYMLGAFAPFNIRFDEPRKIVSRAVHVLNELGMTGLILYLRHGIIPQLEAHAERLSELPDQKQHADELRSTFANLAELLDITCRGLTQDDDLTTVPKISGKVEKLIELVEDLFDENSSNDKYKIIIFVNRVALTFPIKHILDSRGLMVGCISGVGSMTDVKRDNTLNNFRLNKLRILVCTPSMEEGVDIPSCSAVIRFEKFDTAKSHIQGSGRARTNAKIFYFDNCPEVEQAKRRMIEQCACNSALGLTSSGMSLGKKLTLGKDVPGVHPWRRSTKSGVLNVFNSVQIVNEYVQKVLKQCLPEELQYRWKSTVVRRFPPKTLVRLNEVMIPTPDGEYIVNLATINAHWGEYDIKDVVDSEQIKKWKSKVLEKRRFMFVVAIELSKLGLLDDWNKATSKAIRKTYEACGPYQLSSKMKVKNLFPKADPSRNTWSSEGQEQAAESESIDYKSLLNANFQKRLRKTFKLEFRYEGKFQAMLRLDSEFKVDPSREFLGEVRSTKKAAAQACAKKVLEELFPEVFSLVLS